MRRTAKISPSMSPENKEKNIDVTKTIITGNNEFVLYEAFKPILLSLKIIGLHYGTGESSSKFWAFISMLFCWTIMVLSFTLIPLSIFSLRNTSKVDAQLLIALSSAMANVLCAMNVLSLAVASQNRRALRKVLTCFGNLQNYGGSHVSQAWIRRIVILSCVVSWMSVSATILYYLYYVIKNGNQTPMNAIYYSIIQEATISQAVLGIITIIIWFYDMASWVFIACLQILFGIILHREIILSARSLKQRFVSTNCQLEEELETERKRFKEITRLIKAVDRSMSIHHVASFSCNVGIICIILYTICYFTKDIHQNNSISFFVLALLVCSLDIAIVCTSGILVTSAVSINK